MNLTVSRNVIANHSYGCSGVDIMVYLDTLGYVMLLPERITFCNAIESNVARLSSIRATLDLHY